MTDWHALGAWSGDATGGKAIRDLGYEIEEERVLHEMVPEFYATAKCMGHEKGDVNATD